MATGVCGCPSWSPLALKRQGQNSVVLGARLEAFQHLERAQLSEQSRAAPEQGEGFHSDSLPDRRDHMLGCKVGWRGFSHSFLEAVSHWSSPFGLHSF